ncbi:MULTISPECIES: MFS transporter [unclassified Tsukamurella]|uniref:MFS transporter n=1 Tax=unclassified Tsukamurella TaxID=2633480 RepID=UPI0031BAA27C
MEELGPHYKWIALSNTTLGMLIATINSSIVLIALPDIFKGIHLNPLESGNTSYLLWMMMGFLVVTAVLVVSFGRLGDMFGRARMYNMGFAVFTISSIFLAVTWFDGGGAALWMIFWRVIQGIGGAFLMANSSAILTDAFPSNQRGLAMGINGVAAIAGSFLGLLIGGVLAPWHWHLVFLVSVPFGLIGTIWAYLMLHDTGTRIKAKMDWWGNITFAVGLIAILVGITYGIQPYGDSNMGWTNPWVLTAIIGGLVVLVVFVGIELKVANPLFNLKLFRDRSFAFGNLANLMASIGRGGLQFILIIWLQGIWLPQHGYDYSRTPLWAGIYMVPMTIGFLLSAPVSGALSDKIGAKWFTVSGLGLTAVTFGLLIALPVDFNYWAFAAILLVNGISMGMFASPNRAEVMNSLPANARGSGAGMMTTFQNAAMVLSIGLFFSLMIAGLSSHLPSAMFNGLTANGVSQEAANNVANLPTVGVLFAAFLGYNPVQELLSGHVSNLSQASQDHLFGLDFFPHLISDPFSDGLTAAFTFALICCAIGAIASLFTGSTKRPAAVESVGEEIFAVAGDSGGSPSALVERDSGEPGAAAPAVAATAAVGTATAVAGTAAAAQASAPAESAAAAPAAPAMDPARPVGLPVGVRPSVAGVISGSAGKPIAGAQVTITDATGNQVGRGETDADGRYGVAGLAAGVYTAIATAPGFAPQAFTARVAEGRTVDRDFELVGGTALVGVVRDDKGGVPALVMVTDQTGAVVARAEAGPDGTFRLAGVQAGTVAVTATAPGYQPSSQLVAVAGGDTERVEIVLAAIGGVQGHVRAADGSPLVGATVSALGPDRTLVASVVTDAEGFYRLEGLTDGRFALVASMYEPAAVQVKVAGGRENVADISLGSAAHPAQ